MARINVEYINRKIDTEDYENTIIELPDGEIVLRAPLRMSGPERKELSKLQKSNEDRTKREAAAEKAAEEAGEEYVSSEDAGDVALEFFRNFLTILADDKDAVGSWLTEIGDDIGFLKKVVEVYTEAVNLGEASPSES